MAIVAGSEMMAAIVKNLFRTVFRHSSKIILGSLWLVIFIGIPKNSSCFSIRVVLRSQENKHVVSVRFENQFDPFPWFSPRKDVILVFYWLFITVYHGAKLLYKQKMCMSLEWRWAEILNFIRQFSIPMMWFRFLFSFNPVKPFEWIFLIKKFFDYERDVWAVLPLIILLQCENKCNGCSRALDNAFTERLWRSVKNEEVYLNDYQKQERLD